MLAELDVVVYLKTSGSADEVAQRVFGALNTPYEVTEPDESGATFHEGAGLGFRAVLAPNSGDLLDPEFEGYSYAVEISSEFWCVELDTLDLDSQLSEYFARLLAFELNVETATEVLIETTEEAEIFEIRSYRRNPQYRLDQSPTTPKVFVVEARQVEAMLEEEWETEEDGEYEDDDEEEGDVVAAEPVNEENAGT